MLTTADTAVILLQCCNILLFAIFTQFYLASTLAPFPFNLPFHTSNFSFRFLEFLKLINISPHIFGYLGVPKYFILGNWRPGEAKTHKFGGIWCCPWIWKNSALNFDMKFVSERKTFKLSTLFMLTLSSGILVWKWDSSLGNPSISFIAFSPTFLTY